MPAERKESALTLTRIFLEWVFVFSTHLSCDVWLEGWLNGDDEDPKARSLNPRASWKIRRFNRLTAGHTQ
ncbi:unnamed protein product, partial [Ceratitis capitata]